MNMGDLKVGTLVCISAPTIEAIERYELPS
jgi:hypothetical protein